MDTLRWDRMEGYPGERNVDRQGGWGGSSKTVHQREGGGAGWGREQWPYWFWSTSTLARCLTTMLTTSRHSCFQAEIRKFNLGSYGGIWCHLESFRSGFWNDNDGSGDRIVPKRKVLHSESLFFSTFHKEKAVLKLSLSTDPFFYMTHKFRIQWAQNSLV